MKYVSIDIETTGLDPEKHQMIEFGAVLEDTENPQPIDKLPKLRILIVHPNYTSNPYCIKLHSKLFEELGKHAKVGLPEVISKQLYSEEWVIRGINTHDFQRIFTRWLKEKGFRGKKEGWSEMPKKLIVAGKNFNGFDAKFLKPYLGYSIPIHHRVLDPMTLFVKPCDQEPPNLSECAKRAGVDFKGSGYHTAVSDAVMVIELLRAGWTANKENYEYSSGR